MSNTAALATVQTTNVKGYFNGNKWPIHVGISELNVTLTLKPGQFVETADHRKINDPLFEAYTKPFQLNKERARPRQPRATATSTLFPPSPSTLKTPRAFAIRSFLSRSRSRFRPRTPRR